MLPPPPALYRIGRKVDENHRTWALNFSDLWINCCFIECKRKDAVKLKCKNLMCSTDRKDGFVITSCSEQIPRKEAEHGV